MLRSAQGIIGYNVLAKNGEVGKVKDFYFDDIFWAIRYVVVDTGKLLPGRKVLVSPEKLGEPDWDRGVLPVSLTMDKVKKSPGIETDAPVSRQHEVEIAQYYGWEPYWGTSMVPPGAAAIPVSKTKMGNKEDGVEKTKWNPNLRSIKEILGYHIQTMDGEVGHLEDCILETKYWVIRYIVVDTRNWLPGRKVILAPTWIDDINWADRKIIVDLIADEIKKGPEYDPTLPVNRAYETVLYDFYGRPAYWE
jgi:sporulation protein YlmC with PRC-barrel domain